MDGKEERGQEEPGKKMSRYCYYVEISISHTFTAVDFTMISYSALKIHKYMQIVFCFFLLFAFFTAALASGVTCMLCNQSCED